MSQIMVDTDTNSPEELLLVASFLTHAAALRGVLAKPDIQQPLPPPIAPAAPAAVTIPAPVADEPNPAAIFGSNAAVVVPPPPPPVPFPAATAESPPAGAPAVAAIPNTVITPPSATPIASPSDVELDVQGLPWDSRIHAETKARNKDGSWRTRRNLNKDVLAAVTAELRQSFPAPAASVAAPPVAAGLAAAPAPAPVIPPPPPAIAVPVPPAPAPVASTAGAVPPPPPPPPGSPASVLPGQVTFASLMSKITGAMNGGKLTKPQVDEALAANGYASLPMLAADPARIAEVDAYLKRWGI